MRLIDRKATNGMSTLQQTETNQRIVVVYSNPVWIVAHQTNQRMSLKRGLHLHASRLKKENKKCGFKTHSLNPMSSFHTINALPLSQVKN
jgi:hypothetical protein